MEVYSTSFTLPRPSGSVAFTDDSIASAASGAASSRSPAAISPPPVIPEVNRTRPHEGQTYSGRISAMRSRLPPSVKAFMPAAFGGSKRTSERIAEAVGPGAEREGGENETDGEVEVVKDTKDATAKDAAAIESTGKQEPIPSDKENRKQASTEKSPQQPVSKQFDQRSFASKNRDSRSTMGTNSSADFSSTASADSTTPSTAPAMGSSKAPGGSAHSPSEPRSTTHSASGSLSTFGYQHQMPSTTDLTESMQKLSVEAMSSHQCLVSFTAIQGAGNSLSTFHTNSSSTSLGSSDPFNRQTFPSLPGPATLPFPSQYPYQQYSQGFDAQLFSTASTGHVNQQSMAPSPMSGMHKSQSASNIKYSVPASQSTMKAPQYNFHVSGGYQQVMAARGQILRDHPFKTRFNIKVARNDLLEIVPSAAMLQQNGVIPSDCLKSEVRRRLDEIAISCKCLVSVLSNEHQGADLGFGLETEKSIEIVISGQFEGAEHARVRIMVMLDELSGLQSEACEIDYKLHNIIGGRKRCVIQTIQEETGTNIYLPTPFSGVLASNRNAAIYSRQNTVYITGEYFGVQRAKEMLFQVSMHRSKNIISRDTAVLPRKIDWMILEKIEDVRSIMMDDATFINLPMLGSQTSLITVYGDNRVSIERTIRSLMQLACQFYIASLWLLPPAFDNFMMSPTLSASQAAPLTKQVSNSSGAEVVFKGNCFELHGLETEVRQAVLQLLDSELIQAFHFEVRFQIELANDHREFISGKKNGKINKIMKQGVRIKFETFNDYNFLIDISSNDRGAAMQGLALLLEELPAEVSFHIPENYHKRIIGVGGKNIQRTMKKYGVYVKFYSKQDLDMETYPFLDCEDNVIARTPAKNSINLENLKVAVMDLVSPKDRDFVTETVPIARRNHRTLLSEKGIFIHDIENKLGCMIRFPSPEAASDLVSIFGPESQIHMAAQMLLDHVPFEAEYRTPFSNELERLLASHEYVALTERVKRDLNISISPTIVKRSTTLSSASSTAGSNSPKGEAVFKLRLNRSNVDFLPASKEALEDFLVSRNIEVYESQERQRSDSFASSFRHFANKLISTVPQAAESTDSFQTDSAARYHQQQQVQENNRLRAAASSPDIKALFESPGVSQGRFFSGNKQSTAVAGSGMLGTTAGVSSNAPMVNSSLYTSPYQQQQQHHDGNSANNLGGGGNGGDVWGAPKFFHRGTAGTGSTASLSAVGPGIAFPPTRTTKLSDASKGGGPQRAEEEAARELEESMKAIRKPRSFSHRTQSLDIGALAAQQVMQQAMNTNVNEGGMNDQFTGFNTTSGQSSLQRPFGVIGGASNIPSSMSGHTARGASTDYTKSMGIFAPSDTPSQASLHQPQHSPYSTIASHHHPSNSFSAQPQYHHHQQQQSGYFNQQPYPPQQHQQQQVVSPQQHQQRQQSQQYQPSHHHHHHHHHIPSPSISRLAPSAAQRAPEPETADEVLRSLAQLHFPPASS